MDEEIATGGGCPSGGVEMIIASTVYWCSAGLGDQDAMARMGLRLAPSAIVWTCPRHSLSP